MCVYFKRDLRQLQNLETARFRLVSPNDVLEATSTLAGDLEQQKQMEMMKAVVIADPYDPAGHWSAFGVQLERGFWFSFLQKQPRLRAPRLPWEPG